MAESKYSVERAKEYQKIRQVLTLVNLLLTPILLLLVMGTGLSSVFKQWATIPSPSAYAVLGLYFLTFSLAMLAIDLPLAYYSGFVLEHRFELSNQTLGAWLVDLLKKSILSFLLSLVLLEMLYALIWHLPENWWIGAWAAYAVVSYVFGKLFPVLIVPIFYRYSPLENTDLKKRILEMAGRYDMPVENVYSLDLSKTTKKANAAFMGLGKTKRVVLSDTLLDNFSTEEIETVVAHELGHYKHHDLWKQLGLGLVTSFAGFWIAFKLMNPLSTYFGYEGVADAAAMPLLFLLFYLFYLILMPVQNGFSRLVEKDADRFALKAYPRRDVFISCMDKLGKVNLSDPEPHPLYEWFFYDHPSIRRRIQMAENWGKE